VTYHLQLSDDEKARYRLMAVRTREQERDLWQLAGLVADARVVDVGCGPGAVLALICQTVGPGGWVTGVDADLDTVLAARAIVQEEGLSNAEVVVGPADATGLPPGSFDVAVLRHVLAHNGGREQQIVDHLATLVRPGGCLYLVDLDSFRSDDGIHPDIDDLRERYARWQAHRGNDLHVGRRLADLGAAAGLTPIQYRVITSRVSDPPGIRGPAWAARHALVNAGFADPHDITRWDAAYQDVDTRPQRPERTVTICIAICQKPLTAAPPPTA
jgi:SAM-dependent methyltransferase